jgi:hypothetical protein
VRFPAAGTRRPGRLSRAATSALANEARAIAAPRKSRGNRGPETARPPLERLPSRQRSRRVARRRAQPVVVPSAPVGSADRSVNDVEVLTGPQHPLGRAPGRQQQARRGTVLARSTVASEARRGW